MDQKSYHAHATVRGLMLLIALSFHSVFEGLAIGLQKEMAEFISLFLAVIAHKAVMAFSLGMTLAQSALTAKQYLASLLIFSLASPIGIGIGMLVVDMDQSLAADVANAILQGIACGTFLYVTFFEVLPHEFNQQSTNSYMKLFFLLLGFTCICLLIYVSHC